MEDERAKFILEIPALDERRIMLIEYALELAVTKKSLAGHENDGYASRKQYVWAKGELRIEVDLSHTAGGIEHVEVRVYELDALVFQVSAAQRVSQRKRVLQNVSVRRDIRSYWEAIIRYARP